MVSIHKQFILCWDWEHFLNNFFTPLMWKLEGHCFPLRLCYRPPDIRRCFLPLLFSAANSISLGESTCVLLSFCFYARDFRASFQYFPICLQGLHLKQRGFLFFEQQSQCRTQVKLSQGHVVSRCGIRLWLVGSRLSTWAPCLSEQDCPTSDGHLGCWWSWPCVTICYGKDTVSIASNSGL